MTTRTWIAAGLAGSAVLVGCGSSDSGSSSGGGQQGTPNKQAATQTTQSTIGAVQSALKPGTAGGTSPGFTSANQLSGAASQTQQIVTPAAQGSSTGKDFVPVDLSSIHTNANPPGTTGGCDCAETSCTFTACKTGAITIDGSYSWGGGHLVCTGLKYTFGGAAGGYNADVTTTLDCDMTATTTSLDGTFHTKGSTSVTSGGGTYATTWDTKITFKKLAFAATGGAPTGGSEHVTGSVTSSASGGGPTTYNADFDVTFP